MLTMEKALKQVTEIAEEMDWTINADTTANCYELQKHSPAGQDFNLSLEVSTQDEFVSELIRRYEAYDPSEEAYIWLDSFGHGTNGAPYEMGDLYDDMVKCEGMMLDLIDAFQKEL